jgi:hypothetical protein
MNLQTDPHSSRSENPFIPNHSPSISLNILHTFCLVYTHLRFRFKSDLLLKMRITTPESSPALRSNSIEIFPKPPLCSEFQSKMIGTTPFSPISPDPLVSPSFFDSSRTSPQKGERRSEPIQSRIEKATIDRVSAPTIAIPAHSASIPMHDRAHSIFLHLCQHDCAFVDPKLNSFRSAPFFLSDEPYSTSQKVTLSFSHVAPPSS